MASNNDEIIEERFCISNNLFVSDDKDYCEDAGSSHVHEGVGAIVKKNTNNIAGWKYIDGARIAPDTKTTDVNKCATADENILTHSSSMDICVQHLYGGVCTLTSGGIHRLRSWLPRKMRIQQNRVTWMTALLVFLALPSNSEGGRRPRLRYMTNYCSDSVQVYSSLILAFTPTVDLPKDRDDTEGMHFKVEVKVDPGSRVMVHFLQMDISPDQAHHDRVKIYDSAPSLRELTPIGGLWGHLDREEVVEGATTDSSRVSDYKSRGDHLTIEYVGVPTSHDPGFKVLLTAFRDRSLSGRCPVRHFRCGQNSRMCVPASTVCDGYKNCGAAVGGEEANCGEVDTVNDLQADYSLVCDIVTMIILPVSALLVVILAAYCFQRQYIRLKIPLPIEPSARYSAGRGRRNKPKDGECGELAKGPPSYQDVVKPKASSKKQEGGAYMSLPPPAYSSLADLVKAGKVEVSDCEDGIGRSPNTRIYREKRRRQKQQLRTAPSVNDSTSSIERETSSPRGNRRERGQVDERESRPYRGLLNAQLRNEAGNMIVACSSDTDDEHKAHGNQSRKKGVKSGKCKKAVVKRRLDEVMDDPTPGSSIEGEGPQDSLLGNNRDPKHFSNKLSPHAHIPAVKSFDPSPSTNSLPSYEAAAMAFDTTDKCLQLSSANTLVSPRGTSVAQDGFSPMPLQFNDKPHPSSCIPPINSKRITNSSSGLSNHHNGARSPPTVPCKVETLPGSTSTNKTTMHPSGASHSPSSSSTTSSPASECDHVIQSETESRPPSHPDSCTESTGSLTEPVHAHGPVLNNSGINSPVREKESCDIKKNYISDVPESCLQQTRPTITV